MISKKITSFVIHRSVLECYEVYLSSKYIITRSLYFVKPFSQQISKKFLRVKECQRNAYHHGKRTRFASFRHSPFFQIIVSVRGVNEVDEMIDTLKRIGVPDSECNRLREQYRDDLDGLAMYVLYMRAILDDRHEYVE